MWLNNWIVSLRYKDEPACFFNYRRPDQLYLTSPQLMEIPSLALSPVAPVRFNLSDPAKSTKWNFAVRVSNSFSDCPSVAGVFPSSSSADYKVYSQHYARSGCTLDEERIMYPQVWWLPNPVYTLPLGAPANIQTWCFWT